MARFRMQVLVGASPAEVWRELADIPSHVEWMADAVAIEFTSGQHEGVGTRFDCATRLGPLRTRDRMEVTRWVEERELAVRHVGLVRGEGVFALSPVDGGRRTRIDWTEALTFPWYLGGPVTAFLAGPFLRRVWRGNLRRLAARAAGAEPRR